MCKEYKIVGSDLVDLKVNQIQLLETIYIPINKKFSFEMKWLKFKTEWLGLIADQT